jgi:hypothetical protein
MHFGRNAFITTILLCTFAAVLFPTSAAAISFSTFVTPEPGDTCPGDPGSTSSPTESSFSCSNREGSLIGHASAAPGSLKANAFAFSKRGVNLGSESAEAAEAGASLSDMITFINNTSTRTDILFTEVNVTFNASLTTSGNAGAIANAQADVEGSLAVQCFNNGCTQFPIFVAVGVPVPIDLSLLVRANANASGQLENASAIADASHTFSFPVGSKVFDLPDGFTVNAPDLFIFDNLFLPPDAETPLPAALPLFAGGLGLIGLLARRRKQRHAAQLA